MDKDRGYQDAADTFRLDFADKDKDYIRDALDTFLDKAINYERKLVEIRMSKSMSAKLEIVEAKPSYRDVPVVVCDMGFDDTIEVLLSSLH